MNINISSLSIPLKNIFNYISFSQNDSYKISCCIKKESLLNFLNTVAPNYELNEMLGILNIWFDGFLWIFPINSKGFYTINQAEFQNFENISWLICNRYLTGYKKIQWHQDYKPLYAYSNKNLNNIFDQLKNLRCIFENISLEDTYYSSEFNSILYLNTGLSIPLSNTSIIFAPYKVYLGKYPYCLADDTDLDSFEKLKFYIDSSTYSYNYHYNDLNYINFKGDCWL